MARTKKETAEVDETATVENEKKSAKGIVFYWLKSNVYKNDTEIVPPGLHKFDEAVERFDSLPANVVEKFEGSIPSKTLYKIAEKLGVNHENKSDDEVLEALLS